MDTERTVEQQLLAHAERQTRALESIRLMVLVVFCVGIAAAVIWLLTLFISSPLVA